jgi:3-oxoacyl-[acyl-carrier-protein] synthase II
LNDELGFDPENPAASCKPFDEKRNGQVVSEASACLVLEDEKHALARGAKIYGYLLGGGSSCVAGKDGRADIGRAIQNAAQSALRRAGLRIEEIGHINAHGLGTTEEDREEAKGLREMIGTAAIPVTALKGYFGNGGAATGLVEIVASLLSLHHGKIPMSLNCSNPEQGLGIDLVTGAPRATSNKYFLKVNYTRAGQASAVVVEAV